MVGDECHPNKNLNLVKEYFRGGEMSTMRFSAGCDQKKAFLFHYQTTNFHYMQKPTLFPVLLVHFIGMLGYSIVMPFLVFLVDRFGGNSFIYGLMGAMYPGFQLIGAPIMGRWSDQIGRKRVLFYSQLGTFLAWGLFIVALFIPVKRFMDVDSNLTGAFVLTIPLLVLFFARALDGLTGGNVSVANAYLSDISTEENRKANFGKMGMAAGLGFILGPSVAGVLGATPYGELIPVLVAALISFVAILLIQFYLPESRAQAVDPNINDLSIVKSFQVEQKECYKMERCPEKTLKGILQLPQMPSMFLIYFLTMLGFSFFYVGFPLMAMNQMAWTSLELGIFFSVSSGLMILVQGPLLSYLADKTNEKTLILTGTVLLSLFFLLLTFGETFWAFAGAICFALGNGLMWPSFLSLLAKTGNKDMQGTIQGYANSTGSLASIIGLLFGGLLMGTIGSILFIASAIVMLIIFGITWSISD